MGPPLWLLLATSLQYKPIDVNFFLNNISCPIAGGRLKGEGKSN